MRAYIIAATAAAVLSTAAPTLTENPIPLVIWHGLGDSASSEGLEQIAALAEHFAPGIFVHVINPTGNDADDDRSATFFGNVNEQVDNVCAQLAAHPILSTAPAIDAIGFSQGGQFLRGYVQRCNFPRVRNLITFGSQHNGITEFRECGPGEYVCKAAFALLRFNVWSGFVQTRLVPAQYFRPAAGDDYMAYLENSNFLADVNNERVVKNETYKKNLASLENFVMYLFGNDTVAIPKETAWFGELDEDGKPIPLKERPIYKEDWLGLKALNDRDALSFRTIEDAEHMRIPTKVLNDTFKHFLGRYKEKAAVVSQFEQQEL